MRNKPEHYQYFDTICTSNFLPRNWDENTDKTWIKNLQKMSPEKNYSDEFGHENFPSYSNWPIEYTAAFQEKIKETEDEFKKIALSAETIYKTEDFTIYACCNNKTKDCFIDHLVMGWPTFSKIIPYPSSYQKDPKIYFFDSIETATYAFINEHKDWEAKFGKKYKSLQERRYYEGIASMSEPIPDYDSLIGSQEECDYCANFGLIHTEIGGQSICKTCFDKSKLTK